MVLKVIEQDYNKIYAQARSYYKPVVDVLKEDARAR